MNAVEEIVSVLDVAVEDCKLEIEVSSYGCRMKFGPDFDWVRGGKLPGLCGAGCMTGCKEVTGLDGFSSRHMWRPCVWPPEHPNKSINCEGVHCTLPPAPLTATLVLLSFDMRYTKYTQVSLACISFKAVCNNRSSSLRCLDATVTAHVFQVYSVHDVLFIVCRG